MKKIQNQHFRSNKILLFNNLERLKYFYSRLEIIIMQAAHKQIYVFIINLLSF